MKKIALCFLIIDCIHHEELWYRFLEKIDRRKYTIYIHYKENKPLAYFESYKLSHCVETSWGDISLVHAQNLLLQEALKDKKNEHFIFLSGSCIPLKHFEVIYHRLHPSYSYFSNCPEDQLFPRCDHALNYIDKKYVQKASQWCILNRKHATLLIKNTDYLDWFDIVPDEHAYITKLYVDGLKHELVLTLNTQNVATTFANWEDSMLKNYSSISQNELNGLLASGHLFGRKFNKECDLSMHNLHPPIPSFVYVMFFFLFVCLFVVLYLKLKRIKCSKIKS